MTKDECLKHAEWAISRARKAGADDAAIDLGNWREIEIEVRDSKLDRLKESTQQSLSISIYANGRYSSHSTNDLRHETLGDFVDEAVSMTKYLSEDKFRTLPDPKYYEGRKNIDLKIDDPDYDKVTSDRRVQIARDIEEVAVAQSDKIISCTAGYSDYTYSGIRVHSNGMEGYRESTSFSAGAEVTVDDGSGGRPADWNWVTSRYFDQMPSLEWIGKGAADRALGKIGQTKLESGVYDMIIENRAASRILGAMSGPLSGRSLQQKSSYLEGKLGQKIASDKLTIKDDPFIEKGLGSRLWDGDGMATKQRTIIDKGILKNYLIDWYYAQKLGVEPTCGGVSNLVFDYGTRSFDEMVKGLEHGIVVTGFIGGNSNSTTGDFSYGIVGKLVENGKVVKPVNEMNISGSLTDFWNQLVELGNDPYQYSAWRRPSMFFKDIHFSGV